MSAEQKCRACGCTENRPCRGGCGWVLLDLCSACLDEQTKAAMEMPITVQMEVLDAVSLIGALQLVLRHPEFRKRPTAKFVEGWTRQLQEHISLTPVLAELLELGWNPAFDVPSESRIVTPGDPEFHA